MRRLFALVLRHGLALVTANVFLEQIGAPIPAIPTLIVAGALTRSGRFTVTALLTSSIVASMIADFAWFLLGRRYGYRILKLLCKISLSPDSCVRETEMRFERWGVKSLVIAKFVPGFSTVAPPIAGAGGHSAFAFLFYDAIGAAIWAGAAIAAGRTFHRAIDRVVDRLETLGGWAVAVVLLLLAAAISIKWAQRIAFYRRLRLARITPAELKAMLDRGESPLIVDVRTRAARRSDPRRVPTALVATVDEIASRRNELNGREIILYCT